MPTSTISGPSSAAKASASRRSAASGTVSTMPDGATSHPTGDPADQRAVAAGSLEAAGRRQLDTRALAFRQHPDPCGGPGQGFIFGGSASGTFALLVDDSGAPVACIRGSQIV